jgi:1,3-propanediol dehydrogenase/alcohol dehydrogenase
MRRKMINNMKNFNYFMPTKVIFGVNSLDNVGNELANLGKKALLVTGKSSARKYGYTDLIINSLKKNNIDTIVFEEIESNPDALIIDKGGQLAKDEGCNFIIGLGGGSAIDAAKGIAAIVAENKSIWDFVEGYEIKKKVLPIVAIPTTAGTGTETTPYSVVSNKKIKRKDAFASKYIYPSISILNPSLTLSLSPYYTATTGMDTLAHAIEAYTSVLANSVSDLFALEAIRLVSENLRTAVSNGKDINARSNMMLASAIAGVAIAQADTTIAHVIGEAIGAIYDTDHGMSVALALPEVMKFNCVSNFEKYTNISRIMGVNISNLSIREAAFKSAEAVRDLMIDIGLPLNLKDKGVGEIKNIMPLVLRPGLTVTNPRSIDKKQFEEIIKASYGI